MWSGGPVVPGIPWEPTHRLIRAGEDLAAVPGVHLICAFVDPAGYLAEWEPAGSRTAHPLIPRPILRGSFRPRKS